MNAKLATIIILLMAVLNLVPPLFDDGINDGSIGFDDKIYYSILWLLLSYTALVIPFLFPKLNNVIRNIAMMLGCWFVAGLIYSLIHFFVTQDVFDTMKPTKNYFSCLIMFIIGIAFIMTHASWKKQKR